MKSKKQETKDKHNKKLDLDKVAGGRNGGECVLDVEGMAGGNEIPSCPQN